MTRFAGEPGLPPIDDGREPGSPLPPDLGADDAFVEALLDPVTLDAEIRQYHGDVALGANVRTDLLPTSADERPLTTVLADFTTEAADAQNHGLEATPVEIRRDVPHWIKTARAHRHHG